MKRMKKLYRMVIGIILVAMMLVMIPHTKAEAAGESLSVSVSSANVIAGNNVTVTVTLNNPNGIASAEFSLNYDSSLMSFVSGDVEGSSFAGVIPIRYMPDGFPTSNTWTFVFQARTTGSCAFTVSGQDFVDPDLNIFAPSMGSASVRIWATGSDDASLSALSVAGFSLSPGFSSGTTEYTCYVGTDVTSVNVSAATTQGGRTELGGNPSALNYGSNRITVTAYAPYGNTRTYTINVVRAEPVTEAPTEAPTEPPVVYDDNIRIDGVEYSLMEFNLADVPQGYEVDVLTIGNEDVPVVTNPVTGITLVYLENEEGVGAFFVYNENAKLYYRYTTLTYVNNNYVIVDNSLAPVIPENTTETEIEILGVTITGLVAEDNEEYVYFYAVNAAGDYNWYSYDTVEATIQRLNTGTEFGEQETESQTVDSGELESLNDEVKSLVDANNRLREQNSTIRSFRNLIVIVASVLLVLAFVIIIVIIKNRVDSKHSIDIDNDNILEEENEDDNFLDEDNDYVYSVGAEAAEMAATEETPVEETVAEEIIAEPMEDTLATEPIADTTETIEPESEEDSKKKFDLEASELTEEEKEAFKNEIKAAMSEHDLGDTTEIIPQIILLDEEDEDEEDANESNMSFFDNPTEDEIAENSENDSKLEKDEDTFL